MNEEASNRRTDPSEHPAHSSFPFFAQHRLWRAVPVNESERGLLGKDCWKSDFICMARVQEGMFHTKSPSSPQETIVGAYG